MASDEPAVAEVMSILDEIWEGMSLVEAAGDETAAEHPFTEHLTGVFQRRGTPLERDPTFDDWGALFESDDPPFFFEGYGKEVVDEALELFMESLYPTVDAIYEEFRAEIMAYEAGLHLDVTGAPVRRQFRDYKTDFKIDYRGDHVFVTAENEGQGIDTVTVRVPPGTLDLLQWNDALSRLPLTDGFKRTLTFFDLDVYSGRSFGLDADGQGYSYSSSAPPRCT